MKKVERLGIWLLFTLGMCGCATIPRSAWDFCVEQCAPHQASLAIESESNRACVCKVKVPEQTWHLRELRRRKWFWV